MKEKRADTPSVFASLAQYCSYRERSAAEVRDKMERMGVPETEHDALLEQLQQQGFQSDVRFSRAFARDKVNLEQWGRLKIRQQLRLKGIPDNQIDDAFEHIDQALYRANLKRLMGRHAAGLKGMSEVERRSRVWRFVSGKGYESELIQELMRQTDGASEG